MLLEKYENLLEFKKLVMQLSSIMCGVGKIKS